MSNVDQNNDRNNGRHEEEEDHPLLNELVQQIRRVAVENGYDPDDCIDMEKTRVILQVTEGDVTSAALLYWDDFLATSGPPPAMAANPPPLQQPAQPPGPPNEQVPAELLVASIARGRPLAQGRLRRWLEHDFRRHAAEGSGSGGNNNSNNSIHRHSDNDDDDDNNNNNQNNDADDHHHQAGEGGFARILVLARETARRQLDSTTNNNNNNNRAAAAPADRQNVAGMAARAAQAYLAAAEAARHGNGHDESASVSDDESGGAWRMMGAALQHQQHVNDEDVEDHTDTSATNQSSFRKRKQRDSENNATSIDSQDYIDVVEDGYLSDNDWLWESLMPRANIPVCTPFEILWGIPPGRSSEITPLSPTFHGRCNHRCHHDNDDYCYADNHCSSHSNRITIKLPLQILPAAAAATTTTTTYPEWRHGREMESSRSPTTAATYPPHHHHNNPKDLSYPILCAALSITRTNGIPCWHRVNAWDGLCQLPVRGAMSVAESMPQCPQHIAFRNLQLTLLRITTPC